MNLREVDASLDTWQNELEAHFSDLHQERQKTGLPIFAIEHPFSAETIAAIAAGLRSRLMRGETLGRHWLLWVVYASELGYDYDGDEYWPSFEKRTPHWREDVDRRGQLRRWFLKFHKSFAGVRPTGAWAAQFSIIAWPITHALLPKDLQNQLAHLLYEQRYVVARFVDASASQVGHLLATSAYACSSRLRNFLEQEELAGRLVLSLLGAPSQGGPSVRESTLNRVVADLNTAREARMWLSEARSVVERARAKLIARRSARPINRSEGVSNEKELELAECRSIRPRLSLMRDGSGAWGPVIEVPSFAGVAAMNPTYASFLRATRCMVAGTEGWNARGWLLYGTQRKRLLAWPDPAKPLIRFEQWNEGLFHLLVAECRLSKGPTWLFRLNRDGTASELPGHSVRLGGDYVLLHKADLPPSPLLTGARLQCGGISASALRVPQTLSDIPTTVLETLGLHVERTVRVWPAGFPPVAWDGEGELEWFASDELCLGLQSDGAPGEFTVAVNGHVAPTHVHVESTGPVFLSLGKLAVGVHAVHLSAVRSSNGPRTSRANLDISIVVRERRRWVPGTAAHAGLIVTTEPYEPTLDELLTGRVRVLIAGPEGRTVHLFVDFLDGSGNVLSSESIGDVVLPWTADAWRKLVDARAMLELDPANSIRASGGRLRIEGSGLGTATVALSHSVAPIRWFAEGLRTPALRLVNDTGHEDEVLVTTASFSRPTTGIELHADDWSLPIRPSGHGGLFTASCQGQTAAIVVSVPSRGGLQELADRPELGGALSSGSEVECLLRWIRDWSNARLVGPLAAQRRAIVIRAMEDQLFETMCWPEWRRAEQEYRERADVQPRSHELLENAVRNVPFALSLSRAARGLLTSSVQESTQAFLGIAIPFRVCTNAEQCEAALRLAATPEKFLDWAGSRTVGLLDRLVEQQQLLRGARMVVLLAGESGRQMFYGWDA